MSNRDIVVIGASAGGIDALQRLLGGLPADLDAAIFVAQHTSRHAGSLLPQVFRRVAGFHALHPEDLTPIEKGHIYIAPPDFHMLLEHDRIRVIKGPRENLHRPAIDPLFRSAAAHFGNRVIGIILTGSLDDGTAGLMVVRARGRVAIIQDPATALFPSMPQSALKQVSDALVLPLEEIPAHLERLVSEELPLWMPPMNRVEQAALKETKISELDMSAIENGDRNGRPSQFACPECGGVLWEIDDPAFLRFRCRVGHAFTARHLGAEQRHAIEAALWSALRALEESASLYQRMAEKSITSSPGAAGIFEERSASVKASAHTLRDFLLHVNGNHEDPNVEAV